MTLLLTPRAGPAQSPSPCARADAAAPSTVRLLAVDLPPWLQGEVARQCAAVKGSRLAWRMVPTAPAEVCLHGGGGMPARAPVAFGVLVRAWLFPGLIGALHRTQDLNIDARHPVMQTLRTAESALLDARWDIEGSGHARGHGFALHRFALARWPAPEVMARQPDCKRIAPFLSGGSVPLEALCLLSGVPAARGAEALRQLMLARCLRVDLFAQAWPSIAAQFEGSQATSPTSDTHRAAGTPPRLQQRRS